MLQNGIEILLLSGVLGGHQGRDDQREVLLQLLPRAGEVAFGLASEPAVFPRLRLEFRLPAAVRRESGLLVRDLRENVVRLPDLPPHRDRGSSDGQRFLGQLAGLGQPIRLGLQEVGEVAQGSRAQVMQVADVRGSLQSPCDTSPPPLPACRLPR